MPLFAAYTDEELLGEIRNGNKEAYAELFNRYWEKAFNHVFYRVQDTAVTEEIVQEIFIKFWDKREDLSINSFPAYLHTCVKHKCLNYIEGKIIREKHWSHYKKFLPTSDDSTSKTIDLNDLQEALDRGLDSIPEKTKLVFTLNRFEGKTIKEIALHMNLSEKTIEYHLSRSIRELRLYLKDFFIILCILLTM